MSTGLEDLKSAYLRLCKDQHVECQDSVIRKISESTGREKSGGGFTLNLSTLSLSPKTCSVLAKLFASDRSFVEVKFNDCSLSDEGVRSIVYGLSDNTLCKHVELKDLRCGAFLCRLTLKGNSIRGPAAESIGRFLRQNTTLKSLCLEWNAIGLIENAFAVFCDGLGASSSLTSLDLRSNQISHVGAGELASALKRNTTLRSMDLRWNSIGLIGARALLAALDHNKVITRIQLAGNNVPADVLRSIDTAVSRNADRTELVTDHQTRQRMMSKEIQHLNKSHRNEVIQLLDKVDRQEAAVTQANRSATERVCRLQEALDERKQQFNNMSTKLSMTESELTLAETKVSELSRQLVLAKEERGHADKLHETELKREREEKTMLEARLNKELIEVNDKNFQLSTKVTELERQCRLLQEQVFELKESLAHQQSQLKLKQTQFEESIHFERQKVKEAYKDAENMKMKEVDRLHKETEEAERLLKDRIQRLESQRLQIEDELSRQKLNAANERMLVDEQLVSAKQRIRAEEEQRRSVLEEKIRVLQTSRDELQTYTNQQSSLVSELQARNTQLSIDSDSLRRRVTDLQQEVAGKNAEMIEEVSRVRIDLNAKVERLESDRRSKEDLYSRISSLEKELSDVSVKHRSVLEDRDRELQRLTDTLRQRDAEIRSMKDADAQRTAVLQSAVQSYCTRSPFNL